MSSVLVESALPGSQLYFPWTGNDDAATPEADAPTAVEPVSEIEVSSQSAQGGSHRNRAGQVRSAPIAAESDRSRVGQPVRIGTMMIKLLKRYGITDAEIAEGLEVYAQKTCQQAAC